MTFLNTRLTPSKTKLQQQGGSSSSGDNNSDANNDSNKSSNTKSRRWQKHFMQDKQTLKHNWNIQQKQDPRQGFFYVHVIKKRATTLSSKTIVWASLPKSLKGPARDKQQPKTLEDRQLKPNTRQANTTN